MKTNLEEWTAMGERLFGSSDWKQWQFKCPACGHVAKSQDWIDAGAKIGSIAFSCVGRWNGGSAGCNYAGGGLFQLNPVFIKTTHPDTNEPVTVRRFDFAPDDCGYCGVLIHTCHQGDRSKTWRYCSELCAAGQ